MTDDQQQQQKQKHMLMIYELLTRIAKEDSEKIKEKRRRNGKEGVKNNVFTPEDLTDDEKVTKIAGYVTAMRKHLVAGDSETLFDQLLARKFQEIGWQQKWMAQHLWMQRSHGKKAAASQTIQFCGVTFDSRVLLFIVTRVNPINSGSNQIIGFPGGKKQTVEGNIFGRVFSAFRVPVQKCSSQKFAQNSTTTTTDMPIGFCANPLHIQLKCDDDDRLEDEGTQAKKKKVEIRAIQAPSTQFLEQRLDEYKKYTNEHQMFVEYLTKMKQGQQVFDDTQEIEEFDQNWKQHAIVANNKIFDEIINAISIPGLQRQIKRQTNLLFSIQDIAANNLGRLKRNEANCQEVEGCLMTNEEAAPEIINYMESADEQKKALIGMTLKSWANVDIKTVGRWKDMGLEVSLETREWSNYNVHEVISVYLLLCIGMALSVPVLHHDIKHRLLQQHHLIALELSEHLRARMPTSQQAQQRFTALSEYIQTIGEKTLEFAKLYETAINGGMDTYELVQFGVKMGICQYVALKAGNAKFRAYLAKTHGCHFV